MSNMKKLVITLVIGISALVLTFGFGQSTVSFWLVAIAGGVMTFTMLLDMIETLKKGKYGVDILAITAIIATLAIGDYWASLMILIMLTGGESLEDYASRQASRELRSLLANTPTMAHKLEGETVNDLPVEKLQVGDIVLVRPDEMIPVDGKVLSGISDVNESSLTGESKPIEKTPGSMLLSGAINGSSALTFEVTALAEDSQYQQLVRLVRESTREEAPFVRLADRYALPFTIAAYVIGGVSWFITKDPVRFAQVLVVASPCPLILAAPVALVAGMSQASKNGIIVKTGTTIEKVAKLKSVAFDKTGTITQGNLLVDTIEPISGVTPDELLSFAASLEQQSSHVLARSLVTYAKEHAIGLMPVQNAKEITAQGVVGIIDGKKLALVSLI